MNGDLGAILEAIGNVASLPMEESTGIPARSYRSPDLFELELEELFHGGWVLIGRTDQVAQANSWVPVDLGGERLMMARSAEGDFHVFSRLCPHRGAELVTEKGKAPLLTCPYHAWSFDLAGRCRAAPLMRDVPGFERGDHGLRKVRHEVWLGFVFVNVDGMAAPLGPRLAELTEKLSDCGIEDYVIARTVDWGELDYDWKILGENSMECYHHVGAHSGSIGRLFPAERSWTDSESDDFVLTISAPSDRDVGGETAIKTVTDAARIVTVFPNGHFTARPGGGTLLQVFPVAAGRSRVISHVMVPRATFDGPDLEKIVADRIARMERVLGEDWEICRRVQNAAGARHAGSGRLSEIEHPLWLFYRYLARALNAPHQKARSIA
jgi:phenylpropionate dioxygenase-like ring-hydroxylating dioxygenase large terminal subunit